MITYIFLGLILGIIILVFLILHNEIKGINNTIYYIANYLTNIDKINLTNNKHIEHLLDRFNERILVNEEYFNIIKGIINSRFKDLDNATDSIYDRFNTIHADIEKYIAAEHIITRRQIEKQAKISSKINSKRKQSNNTQK